MGTRSLTHVKDKKGKTIVTIYCQFDGYPEGMGQDLLNFIKGGQVVNGFGMGAEFGQVFNGIEDFAAQLVTHLKGDQVGNVYLYPPNSKDCWEDYVYTIKPDKSGKLQITCVEVGWGEHPSQTLNLEEALKTPKEAQ